jgi:tripartite-type tricarboxylate transporter receptor subunit TctC
VAEAANLPGYQHVSWGAVFGPANLPAAIVTRMDQVVRAIALDPEFQSAIAKNGSDPRSTPSVDALRAFVAAEVAETLTIMKKLGLRTV